MEDSGEELERRARLKPADPTTDAEYKALKASLFSRVLFKEPGPRQRLGQSVCRQQSMVQ